MYKTREFVSAYANEKKAHPFRTHMERHTILGLATNVKNKDILDLACGSGCYSRLFYEHGAKNVVGIDSSKRMVENAIQNTPKHMSIEYIVANGENYRGTYEFDFVFHSYFLNYATSLDSLSNMCHTISSNLSKGGFMLGIVSMLGKEPSGSITCCDFYTKFEKQPEEGEDYEIHFRGQNESIINYNWCKGSYEKALRNAGLKNIRWHYPKHCASPQMSQKSWQQLTSHRVFLAVTANK